MKNPLPRTQRRWCAAGALNLSELCGLFGEWLDPDAPPKARTRRRLYDPLRTFWMFLGQVLWGNISCDATVSRALAWLHLASGTLASPANGAYVQARKRLDTPWLQRQRRDLTQRIEAAAGKPLLWRGRTVKVVDGSCLSMPDTRANQRRYPQPKTQKPGCGFPVMRLVAVFSLATGAMIDVAYDKLAVGERALFRRLWPGLRQGDIALADCGFCGFADFWLLMGQGVDCLMRNHPRRSVGVRTLKRLGKRDDLVAWRKTQAVPAWMTKDQWRQMPGEIIVRQLTVHVPVKGFRTDKIVLATTLCDPKAYPPNAIAELFRRRWDAELYLRDIKITLGMDVLKCKTPDMVEKEMLVYIIAYNLIRATMLLAASRHGLDPRSIGFKATAETLRHWAPILATLHPQEPLGRQMRDAMLLYIAKSQRHDRPNRTEPRAKKRRPKSYPLLNKPRNQYNEIPHRNRYKAA